ncbi:zinc finger BED domain-containing protein 1-like [Thrips palmi]|uniref:Zinc finger BED domain-containing protein 1-like n=1 Tax=Thrips palmi TaxID=161013 RepID=A0A6P8ZV59_THRPL|nr:zinc finger BED domain-containing protein 1-like [Thrips palmi]
MTSSSLVPIISDNEDEGNLEDDPVDLEPAEIFDDVFPTDNASAEPRRKKVTLLDHFKSASTTENEEQSTSTTEEAQEHRNAQNNTRVKDGPSQSTSAQSDCTLTPEEQAMVDASGSLVWNYFSKDGKDSAKCKICSVVRSTPTGTTKTLIVHLTSHQKQYSQYLKLMKARKQIQEEKKTERSLHDKPQQVVTLKGRFGVLPSSSKRSKDLTRAVALWLAKGLHAYSEVNEPGFRLLMYTAEPRYVVPHRTTFSRSIIPKLYQEEKEKQRKFIESILDFIESLTITTDMWSSRAQDSFLACTVQFIVLNLAQSKFVLKHLTLDLIPFPGSHTSDRICEATMEMVRNIGVNCEEVKVYIITDNASNMVAALAEPSLQKSLNPKIAPILRESREWTDHLRCTDHTLQLVIGDARKEIGFNTIIEKVVSIVNRYSYSNVAKENLKKKQVETKTVQHSLITHVATRWNSEFLMMDRFLEQKTPITLELSDAGEENLTALQWKMVEGYVEVLKPIAMFTADLGSTKQPTPSMVIPVVFEIKNCLEDFIKNPSNKGTGVTFARAILKHLNIRFNDSDYLENPLYQRATLLDPRFKDLLIEDKSKAVNLLVTAAKEKYRQNVRRGRVEAQSTLQSDPVDAPSEPHAKKKKWGHLQKIQRTVDSEILDVTNIIQNEVKTYLAMPPIDADKGDAILWWELNMKTFPHLVGIAAEYLGIAATEIQSERDFSTGNDVVTPNRTKVLTQHVRQMVFLHRNLEVPTVPDHTVASPFLDSSEQ